MSDCPRLTVRTGARAWDMIWKWMWFTKDAWPSAFREPRDGTRRALSSLLPKLRVRSVLDCSCGLGWKTLLLAQMGYDAEGSDGSAFAVKHAAELAAEEGLDIRFFRSRWDSLGEEAGRRYDCVYCDSFAWITSRRSLLASARGVHPVLKRGGKFIFVGAHEWSADGDNARSIDEQFENDGPFEALPVSRSSSPARRRRTVYWAAASTLSTTTGRSVSRSPASWTPASGPGPTTSRRSSGQASRNSTASRRASAARRPTY